MNKIDQMRKSYSNGQLLKESDWDELDILYKKLLKISEKTDYFKENVLTEKFTKCDIEEYELIVKTNQIMYTVLIDLYDYLDHKSGKTVEIFSSDEEAQNCIDSVFERIEKLKEDLAEYYTKEVQ